MLVGHLLGVAGRTPASAWRWGLSQAPRPTAVLPGVLLGGHRPRREPDEHG
jgi:hypothetical protein